MPDGNDSGSAATVDSAQAAPAQAAPAQAAPAQAAPAQAAPVQGSDLYGAPASGYKVSDGVNLDEALTGDLSGLGKELNLSQKGMESVYKLAAKYAASTQANIAKAHQDNLGAWRNAIAADQELGGPKLAENRAVVAKAIDVFAPPGLSELLRDSGISEHPLIFKMLHNVGKAVSEDRFVRGGANQGSGGGSLFTYSNSDHT